MPRKLVQNSTAAMKVFPETTAMWVCEQMGESPGLSIDDSIH
jgi:hypothetical protein